MHKKCGQQVCFDSCQGTWLAPRLFPIFVKFKLGPGSDTGHGHTVKHKPATNVHLLFTCVCAGMVCGNGSARGDT